MLQKEEYIMIDFTSHARRLAAVALAALIALPQVGFAQTPAKSAPAKPAPVALSQQKVELLFVQNATGIEYDKAKGTLRMKNIARSTLFFTDRPVRMAGHYHTRDEFLPLWSEGPDSFAKSPPNATLSILEVGKADLQNAVINLKNPRMQGKDLIYDITIIEGTVPPSAGDAVLFIDILGFWRRNIRRVAVIGTAAAVTTAAVATSSAEASAAAARAAAPPPATVNVQVTAPPAAAPAPQTAPGARPAQRGAPINPADGSPPRNSGANWQRGEVADVFSTQFEQAVRE